MEDKICLKTVRKQQQHAGRSYGGGGGGQGALAPQLNK